MFSVGQRVWHKDGQRSGTVLECDGDRVYIEQDNGAELDFRAADLTATPPHESAARPRQSQAAAPAIPGRVLTARDITPDHARVLAIIPARIVQAVAAFYERGSNGARFSALDTAAKLNLIADITAVPYRMMQRYSDSPGELGLLMGKGLADRTNAR